VNGVCARISGYLLRPGRSETPSSRPKVNTRPATRSGLSLITWRSSATLIWPLGARISIICSSSSSEKLSFSLLLADIAIIADIGTTVKYVFVLVTTGEADLVWLLTKLDGMNESVFVEWAA